MVRSRDQVLVHLDATELGSDRVLSVLSRERSGTKSVVSFAYVPEWVSARDSFALDPALPLYQGEQYPPTLPGIFTDAAPDRWGRTLLERREGLTARREERKPRHLDDWDFLVGVNDSTRMGALRFARITDGAFLDNEPIAVPPSTRLRDLEHWAAELEKGLPRTTSDEERWIAMLIASGSSLGGARPKASFLGDGGALWMAKFPSREDRHDVGAWEYVVTRLAQEARIDVPEIRVMRLASRYHTFSARRFDRRDASRRLYASAMTLVGKRDREDASYLDIAQAIVKVADPAGIAEDLEQLFRRVLFNVLTSNRDDHLRNHGFLRTRKGWRIAPAFDINPSPEKLEHSLALNDTLRVPSLEIVRETGPFYRLSSAEVKRIINEVQRSVARWAPVAREAGISEDEVEGLAPAFELASRAD